MSGKPKVEADPQILDDIVIAVGMGIRPTVAARMAGISKPTYYRYLEWAKEGREPFASWSDKLDIAHDVVKAFLLRRVVDGINSKDPQVYPKWAAWMLEKRFPSEYGNRVSVKATVSSVDYSQLSDRELEALDSISKKLGAGDGE